MTQLVVRKTSIGDLVVNHEAKGGLVHARPPGIGREWLHRASHGWEWECDRATRVRPRWIRTTGAEGVPDARGHGRPSGLALAVAPPQCAAHPEQTRSE